MNDTPEPGIQNDYDYEGGEGGEEADDEKSDNPVIESKPMEFIVDKFQSVVLPCKTSGAGECYFLFLSVLIDKGCMCHHKFAILDDSFK